MPLRIVRPQHSASRCARAPRNPGNPRAPEACCPEPLPEPPGGVHGGDGERQGGRAACSATSTWMRADRLSALIRVTASRRRGSGRPAGPWFLPRGGTPAHGTCPGPPPAAPLPCPAIPRSGATRGSGDRPDPPGWRRGMPGGRSAAAPANGGHVGRLSGVDVQIRRLPAQGLRRPAVPAAARPHRVHGGRLACPWLVPPPLPGPGLHRTSPDRTSTSGTLRSGSAGATGAGMSPRGGGRWPGGRPRSRTPQPVTSRINPSDWGGLCSRRIPPASLVRCAA